MTNGKPAPQEPCEDCGRLHDPDIRCPNYHAGMAPVAQEPVADDDALLDDIAEMMSEFVDNWPQPKKIETALPLIAKTMRAALSVHEVAADFIQCAHKKGPTSDDYWASCRALEEAIDRLQAKAPQ